MGSTIAVSSDIVWMVKSRTFDLVRDLIVRELSEQDSSLIAFLLNRDYIPSYLDLGTLDSDQFCKVLTAAEKAFEKVVAQTSNKDISAPEYEWFLVVFSQLKAFLKYDPRSQSRDNPGKLIISAQIMWTSPNPWYDMLLENAAALSVDEDLSKLLLDSRKHSIKYCDASNLTHTQYCKLLGAIKALYERHKDGVGPGMLAFDFFGAFAPLITDLYQKMMLDERAETCR